MGQSRPLRLFQNIETDLCSHPILNKMPKIHPKILTKPPNSGMFISIEIQRCLKRDVRDIVSKSVLSDVKTTFTCTSALKRLERIFRCYIVCETKEDYKEGCLMMWANYMSPCNSIIGLYFKGTCDVISVTMTTHKVHKSGL